jgi:hypothetical protein
MGPADHVRDWLKKLGGLIAPSMSPQEFAGRINVLAPELIHEFPPGAFTHDSARLVARKCTFFPNFAELCAVLAPWWHEQRAAQAYAALPPPRVESQEPYQLPPAPEWCFERKPRLMGSLSREDVAALARKPVRSVAEQYAAMTGCSLDEATERLNDSLLQYFNNR